jgi:aminoglycoside 6-adenylyltransferase
MASELERAVTRWAAGRGDVRALLIVGSRARTDAPADEYSDHDFVLVVDDDEPFLASAGWVREIGRPLLTFIEDTATGGMLERRVLFDDGADADFTLMPVALVDSVFDRPDVRSVLARGVRVLHDEGVIGELPTDPADPPPAELQPLVHEFWYRALLTLRKLRRGEVHVAAHSCNCGLRPLLRRAIALEATAAGRDAWHEGRFFERWARPEWRERMAATVALEDPDAVAAAVRAACDLFEDVCATLEPVAIDRVAVRRHVDALS